MGGLDFAGKRVLVTGGSGDIGKALCAAFAGRGAKVAFTWCLSHEGRDATAALIEGAGGEALPVRANLRDRGAAGEIAQAVQGAWGGADVLIHNAATGVLKPALELKEKHWQATMDVNAYALLALVQAIAPAMPAGGRVLTLSSSGGVRAIPYYAAVGASKAAMESLVRHLALELGPRGITINALCPGVVDTQALKHFPNRQQLLDVAAARTPNGRIATPRDVADVALLLASPLAAMIQGQVINIDGGYSVLA